jgi:AcrR family transcriptional regulator
MESSQSTRDRILDCGIALASQAGLEGVTLGVLSSQVRMSKSGLFAHFRSKEAVQISLLEHSKKLARATIIEPAMKEPEGLPRLQALATYWLGWASRAGLPGGCPVAAGMFEYDDVEGPVRDKIKQMEAEWRDLLCSLTIQAVKHGHFRSDLDVNQFVWELCGIYLSHHTASRFLRSPDADRHARTAIEALSQRASVAPRKRARRIDGSRSRPQRRW